MAKKSFLLNILAAVLATALLLAACGENGPAGTQATDTLPELTLPNFGPDPWGTKEEQPSSSETEEETLSLPEETTTEPETAESSAETEAEIETETETGSESETEPETETEKAEGIPLAADDLPDNIWIFRRGRTYYLGEEKKITTGLVRIGGQSYFFGEDGVMAQKKFVTVAKKLYYFGEDGAMLKNTKVSGYTIDGDGVCTTDYSGRFTLTEANLNEYCDYLLQKYGNTPEAIFNFIWKNYGQRPNEPIGNLMNPTQSEINRMIIRFFNDGGGACCDYSYAAGRLLERAGYRNVIVHCDPRQSRHQWNLVQIRPGVWRHMDTYRKAFKVFLLTDDEIAAFDTDNVPYRWDRTKWTSETATGTGGKNPEKETDPVPTTEAPPETTEAPKPTETQPKPTEPTTEAPETTKAPETTEAPKPTETEAPTEEPTTAEPTTAAPETTEAPETSAPVTTEAPAPETPAPETTTAAPAEDTTSADTEPEQPGESGT